MGNHQHNSSTGDTENCHGTSLANGVENRQDDSVFDDMGNHPLNISVGNVKDHLLNAGCLLVIHWQLVLIEHCRQNEPQLACWSYTVPPTECWLLAHDPLVAGAFWSHCYCLYCMALPSSYDWINGSNRQRDTQLT